MKRILPILPAVLLASGPAGAFNGHDVTAGPLRVTIAPVPDVTRLEAPQEVRVRLANSAAGALRVHLALGGLIDEWRAVGATEKDLLVPGAGTATAVFRIAAGRGTHSALYPVHVWATFADGPRRHSAHAVQVFATKLPAPPAGGGEWKALPVPADGSVALADVRACRVTWQQFDRPAVSMPVGWRGSAEPCRATFLVRPVTRGTTKPAVEMHPPWRSGAGTIFVEYRLALPKKGPIVLRFANAIRDHSPTEPPSDGVTFRVWADGEKLFERHTDSKRWLDGEVDLGRFAGKTILLRLESHPGPKRDTTCDSSYWGEPTVLAGRRPPLTTEAQRQALRERARRAATADDAPADDDGKVLRFDLAGGCRAAVACGPAGLVDGALAFGRDGKCVVLDGFRPAVEEAALGGEVSAATVDSVRIERHGDKRVVVHSGRVNGEPFVLRAELRAEGAGLRARFDCTRRITDLSPGPADQVARRVYYGHGYCIVEPRAFRAGFGGHNLSTSHVGFDFAGGMSLLVASDNPPDYLEVAPDRRLYALHTHENATLTFVPSPRGAMDCAVGYQPLYDKPAAGGFARKAGRFVFDIWGGRYAEIARTMRRMIAYGLTDSLLTVHVWQRWGYDYRLPEIYPPNPALGTVADMRQIAAVCQAADIPWGLHDNYIDFYPDANGYSYEHICFTRGGRPVKAWLNESRNARSYRWRPDAFMPFLQRNVRTLRRELGPTAYFLDVFTSIGPFDYYDRRGRLHSFLQTRRCWGEAFAWIREHLGGSAPTSSEAGHDQLVGYLDGADCQHLRLSPAGGRFRIRLPCRDWARTPWFDAVLHDRFSLHGVGYSNRYQSGRPRDRAGIESDDYLSDEILLGHALMIDRGGFGRGAVRKYWLAQAFVRAIATDRIARVEYVGGDIHRQAVTWRSGAKVYVNRGRDDWHVAGRTLPPMGYLAAAGPVASSIERIDGVIVEQSRRPGAVYVDGRAFPASASLAIRPTAERVEDLGGGRFRLLLAWQADRPAPKDLGVFLHFDDPSLPTREKIAFQGDFRPTPPTSRWQGRVLTGRERVITVPDGEARRYEITVGLWDPLTGRRYPLPGEEDGTGRYRLGTLLVERAGRTCRSVRLVRREPAEQHEPRWNRSGRAVDFGPVVTAGAVRCQARGGRITVTPLPDSPPFDVTLRPGRFAGAAGARVRSIRAVDIDGRALREVPFTAAGGAATFRTRPGEFAYEVRLAGGDSQK